MEFIFQLIADLFLDDKDEAVSKNETVEAEGQRADMVAEAPLAQEEQPVEANIFTMMEFH